VKVTNTGSRAGMEVVQLYVGDKESSVIRPDKELKGFVKISLEPGESKFAVFELDKRSFAYYSEEAREWIVETGEFELLIGRSSQEIVLSEQITVESTTVIRRVFHRNSTLSEISQTASGEKFVNQLIANLPFSSGLADEHKAMLRAFMEHMPLRGLISFSGGKFTEAGLTAILLQLNNQEEEKR
jgi:beta-glucosidase